MLTTLEFFQLIRNALAKIVKNIIPDLYLFSSPAVPCEQVLEHLDPAQPGAHLRTGVRQSHFLGSSGSSTVRIVNKVSPDLGVGPNLQKLHSFPVSLKNTAKNNAQPYYIARTSDSGLQIPLSLISCV